MGDVLSWPPVGYEEYAWHPDGQVLDVLPRRQREQIRRPYQASVVPCIADLDAVRLPREVERVVAEATNAVVRFDERMANVPVPMPAVLLRSESATSSQIERLTASARTIAMATIGATDRRNAVLVAANVSAVQTALDLAEPVSDDLVLRVHRALLGSSQPGIVGRYRREQVWIGGSSLSPHEASFVPPHHTRVAAAMADLVAFARRDDLPPLVHAALVHAQFETVHPFEDGNGRTGRVLVQSVLRDRGVVEHATVPVSAGLLADIDRYFAALTAYRAGQIAPIVEQVAHAALAATVNGSLLAADIVAVREEWARRLKARVGSGARTLADALFAQPVVNAEWVARATGMPQRSALRAIDTLVEAGVLHETGPARRNRTWQAPEVLAAMDAFAARAGRRTLTAT